MRFTAGSCWRCRSEGFGVWCQASGFDFGSSCASGVFGFGLRAMNALQLRWLSERGRVDRTECSLPGMLKRVPDWGRESRRGPGYGWSSCPATVCRSDLPVATLQNRGSCRSDVRVATGFAHIQASGRRREAPPTETSEDGTGSSSQHLRSACADHRPRCVYRPFASGLPPRATNAGRVGSPRPPPGRNTDRNQARIPLIARY